MSGSASYLKSPMYAEVVAAVFRAGNGDLSKDEEAHRHREHLIGP